MRKIKIILVAKYRDIILVLTPQSQVVPSILFPLYKLDKTSKCQKILNLNVDFLKNYTVDSVQYFCRNISLIGLFITEIPKFFISLLWKLNRPSYRINGH